MPHAGHLTVGLFPSSDYEQRRARRESVTSQLSLVKRLRERVPRRIARGRKHPYPNERFYARHPK